MVHTWARWRDKFDLAFWGRGLVVDLNKVPEYVLEWFKDWLVEARKLEKEQNDRALKK